LASANAPALDLPARFMALGMAGLAVLALLAPWALPLLGGSFYDPRLLAFVHLNTLGVIAALILGASYQLVPVVVETPLASARLGRLSFWCLLGGIAVFLAGLDRLWLPALATGGTLLAVAFGLYAAVIAATLARAPRLDVVAWHIAVALAGAVGAVALGFTLALNKGTGLLGPLTLRLLAAHATLMLGGWVAPMLAGVAYRLVGMFTLAEDALWRPVAWLGLALTAGGAWALALALATGAGRPAAAAGALALLGGQALFAAQLAHLYRRRRRRGPDVHIPFALTAAGAGVLAAAAVAGGLLAGAPVGAPVWTVAGWLAIAGLAETAIQGFFYKIATFLVWLHRYAPLAGRQRVPKLEELYSRRLALAGWACWTLGVALAALATASGAAALARVAGVAVAAGLACFLVNVARIGAHWRAAPARAPRPRRDASAGKDFVRQE
ncbi:MAG TPA: hypothetical protein VFW96_17270, partial [Thermomicrobiales bacterium]|nr:hypothetical protein [Thermomicrobiales bacterium]